jgi:uncharacterized HAD superfamily protein
MSSNPYKPIAATAVPKTGPVVAIDFDGVVTDPDELKSVAFAERGYDMDPTETSREYCLEVEDIPKDDYEWVSRTVNIEWLQQVPLQDGASKGLVRLAESGFHPIIVTSRYDEELESMVEYIQQHNLAVAGYTNTNRNSKLDTVRRLNAEAFIDDSYYKFEELIESEYSSTDLFFFRNASNQYIDSHRSDVVEIHHWDGFISSIIRR